MLVLVIGTATTTGYMWYRFASRERKAADIESRKKSDDILKNVVAVEHYLSNRKSATVTFESVQKSMSLSNVELEAVLKHLEIKNRIQVDYEKFEIRK